MAQAEIGLIGLATMGANLARNISNKGFSICVYNRTTEKTEEFIEEFGNEKLTGATSLKKFVKSLKRPRKIILLVKAGPAVDAVIHQLTPLLSKEDLIIDSGNSNYIDTQRRIHQLSAGRKPLEFLGCGISGGEEGALNGPSMMPGGSKSAYKKVAKIFKKVSARDFNDGPCITYIGDGGAGHYVKMVHNGIEYGVMQMIAEAYDIFRTVYKLPAPKIAEIFQKYNKGKLKSYLFEIASEVLAEKDPKKKGHLIDYILDKAGQKGTGRWTAMDALHHGVSLPTITEAVFARVTSGEKDLRKKLAKAYKKPAAKKSIPLSKFTKMLGDALYAGMLSSYAQGYHLIQKASDENNWKVDLAEVSRIWEGGCIIRADILNFLHQAYQKSKDPQHLFLIKSVSKDLPKNIPALRKTVAFVSESGVPIPALATALSYFEAMTQANSSANMIQGLRDYFGAHTFERIDKKGSFHQKWGQS
jgi:6-phosphogluconate dehydrogenase